MTTTEAAITVTGFGFEPMTLSYDEWARDEIQDENEAVRIAASMLASRYPYTYNEDEPRVYREFTVHDERALREAIDVRLSTSP